MAEVWDVAEVGQVQKTGTWLWEHLGTIFCSSEYWQHEQPEAACQYGQIRDVAAFIESTRFILLNN